MKIWMAGVLLAGSLTTWAAEVQFDRRDKFHGVTVESGKSDDVRAYRASFTHIIPANIHEVRAGIVNFTEKCDNQHSERREWMRRDTLCAFSNESMVETRVERNLKENFYLMGETDRYVLSRRGYNRGSFQYQELVREVVQNNGGTIQIQQTMLSEEEARRWLVSAPLRRDYAYDRLTTTYTLTKLSDMSTELKYESRAETTHWLLNKELVVPQVLASLGRGAKDLRTSVEGHHQRNRQLASQRQ